RSPQVRGEDHVSGGDPARRQRSRAEGGRGQGDRHRVEQRPRHRRRGRLRAPDGEPGGPGPCAGRFRRLDGRIPMKRALFLLGIALLVASCATVHTRGRALVTRAVQAIGGADRLAAVKTVSLKATTKQWEPEQSMTPGGEPRYANESTLEAVSDVAARSA